MEDARARTVAAAVGGVAIGGLWLAHPAHLHTPFRVVDQWSPNAADGPDADVAAAFRLEIRGAVRAALDEGRAVDFRLVDRSGRACPLLPMVDGAGVPALKLVKGYAFPLDEPRLVAFIEGRPEAGVPVRDVPAPVHQPLVPTPNPPLIALFQEGGISFMATHPLADGERWHVEARRTPYARVDAATEVGWHGERRDPRRLAMPYADEAGLLEVDVTRYRLVPQSETIRVPGLRLARRFGASAVIVDREVDVRTHLGVDLRLPRQDNGPRRPHLHGDPREAFANLSVVNQKPGSDFRVRLDLLSPAPASLGLRQLRVGGGVVRDEAPGPPRIGPFTATLRLTVFRRVPIGTFHAVVPVRAPLPTDPVVNAPLAYGYWR